jgi:hypothetical protein
MLKRIFPSAMANIALPDEIYSLVDVGTKKRAGARSLSGSTFSKRATAASTEPGSRRIGGIAPGAQNFHGSWCAPGNRASAQRCAATSTEFCARGLIHAATGATNSGGTHPSLVQAGRGLGLGRGRPGMHRAIRSNWLKTRVATPATKFRARGKARPASGASDDGVSGQGHPGDAAQTPTL